MARITVEDCLKKVVNQYDLVLLAKERTSQLNAGDKPLVPEDNDKKTVIALREIGEGKVSPKDLENSAVDKLRKNPELIAQNDDESREEVQDDDFDKIYKGEVSKSGAAILPSKRVRQIPSKIELSKKNLEKEDDADKKLDNVEEEKLDNVEEEKLDNVEEEKLDNVEEEKLDNVEEKKLDNVEEEKEENPAEQEPK